MSTTTVIAVWPGQKTEDVEELRNAWGSGPSIWDNMAIHYLGSKLGYYSSDPSELWKLPRRTDIPESHRAVLALTYDNMIVLKKDYGRAAQNIRQYLEFFPVDEKRVNHWPRIAEIFESNPDYPAIGLWLTSVCENPFSGEWNEEADEYDPPEWDKYWDVFEWIDSLMDGNGKGAA